MCSFLILIFLLLKQYYLLICCYRLPEEQPISRKRPLDRDYAKSQELPAKHTKFNSDGVANTVIAPNREGKQGWRSQRQQRWQQKQKQDPDSVRQRDKPERKKFQYGNYDRYYGYRHDEQEKELTDRRINLLLPEWVRNKACLDVGCNAGAVTIAVGMFFYAFSF